MFTHSSYVTRNNTKSIKHSAYPVLSNTIYFNNAIIMNCMSLNGLDITEIIISLSSRDIRFHYTNAPEQSKGAVIDGIMSVRS